MAFNWFNRRFSEEAASKDAASDGTPVSETEAAQPADSPDPETETDDSEEEDYLAWAKAAYQNIQQRQGNSAAPASRQSSVADATALLNETDTPNNLAAGADSAAATPPETAALEPASVSAEMPAPEAIAPLPANPAASFREVNEAAVEPSTAIDPVADPSAEAADIPLPLWARADAERQERLDRLKATAIETPTESTPAAPSPLSITPTPPTSAPVAETVSTDEPDLSFDEGFIWSAEVLAAQGRRPDEISVDEITWLQKLRKGLDKTRLGVVNQLKAVVGQGPLNQEAVLEIEALLLQADVGIEATDTIIEALQAKMRQETLPPDAAIAYLKTIIRDILDKPIQQQYSPVFAPDKEGLNIWLITGVNGAGKTTTIGKIAHVAKESGFSCLVAAADTFRAAAVEQVKIWAQRSGVDVIANPGQNTDPAAVVFDAIAAAQSRDINLLLVDTAGRLQNKKNLMDELAKVRRVIDKNATGAKVESLLVLDATLGQNGLRQAQVFAEAAQLSGVVLTKLDGTAKGGVALAVVQQLGLPIRFVGAGEGIQDLRPFSSYEFVEALLGR